MGFRNDERGGTLTHTGSTQANELDLYSDLAAFTALSPEDQSKESERIKGENDQAVVTGEVPARARLDLFERSDLPATGKPEFNQASEPEFSLIDEALFAPRDQSLEQASVESDFAFVTEAPNENSQPRKKGGHMTSELNEPLSRTSPLEETCPVSVLPSENSQECETCGTASSIEELFCPSCGQLLGNIDL